MNSFEAICIAERRNGWFPHLFAEVAGWRCELACGVDVKPANEPRPVGYGPTAEAALTDEIRRRGGAVAAQERLTARNDGAGRSMTELLDTCVAVLLVSDCRDREALRRFQRASRRVEQLLAGIGFPETAKTLRKFRDDCGPISDGPPREEPVVLPTVADPREDDPLAGRKTRRKAVAT